MLLYNMEYTTCIAQFGVFLKLKYIQNNKHYT